MSAARESLNIQWEIFRISLAQKNTLFINCVFLMKRFPMCKTMFWHPILDSKTESDQISTQFFSSKTNFVMTGKKVGGQENVDI